MLNGYDQIRTERQFGELLCGGIRAFGGFGGVRKGARARLLRIFLRARRAHDGRESDLDRRRVSGGGNRNFGARTLLYQPSEPRRRNGGKVLRLRARQRPRVKAHAGQAVRVPPRDRGKRDAGSGFCPHPRQGKNFKRLYLFE